VVLWIEKILHQLVMDLQRDKPTTNWCRISSIHSRLTVWELENVVFIDGKKGWLTYEQWSFPEKWWLAWCQVILGFYDVVRPTELVLLDIPNQWRLYSSLAKMSIEVNGWFMEAMAKNWSMVKMMIYHFLKGLPSGKHTKSYWTWPFIVDFTIKHGDFPELC